MAKLYFRYGAMNSSKSALLLTAAYNYEERDQHPVIVKPGIDTKAGRSVSSRLGVERQVDVLLGGEDSLLEALVAHRPLEGIDAVFIDEAQFLTPAQVDEAFVVAVRHGVPVLCYGLRGDFMTHSFPGSLRLLEIAHAIEELKTICRCGSKAIFNGRVIGGVFVSHGEQVAIDGQQADYESLCGACYLEKVGPVRAAGVPEDETGAQPLF
ncbi:thymidine kinase [Demequina mangrovi]|uniref:Thymidine kinase n=1 Tax=Demequina mangrovi TaxID=1043493 RepID=A0A1H6ZKT1_9MICO|nr:thymidine kinase [Demequina mangrovi]SEJ52157.1 thymidine kinase [Demequina mangrovi]